MTASAELLLSLEGITAKTVLMLKVLDDARGAIDDGDRREAKRRILEIRAKSQELFDWISAAWLEEPRN